MAELVKATCVSPDHDLIYVAMLGAGESVADSVVLKQSVAGVISCLEQRNEKTGTVDTLNTQGVNLAGIRRYASVIDLDCIDSNDVNAVLHAYGVEAARQVRPASARCLVFTALTWIRAISNVNDYMTSEGTLRPFNRVGIDSNASPFLKMSFETCTAFLTRAITMGTRIVAVPSARLVLGKVVKMAQGFRFDAAFAGLGRVARTAQQAPGDGVTRKAASSPRTGASRSKVVVRRGFNLVSISSGFNLLHTGECIATGSCP